MWRVVLIWFSYLWFSYGSHIGRESPQAKVLALTRPVLGPAGAAASTNPWKRNEKTGGTPGAARTGAAVCKMRGECWLSHVCLDGRTGKLPAVQNTHFLPGVDELMTQPGAAGM